MCKVKSVILNDILKTQPGFIRKAIAIILVEIATGFFLSFLINANLGTDPGTFMNINVAGVLHLTFGTWQLLLNIILIVIDIAVSRFQYIGIGTFANMVLIGYSADFFRWIWRNVLLENIFSVYPERIIFFIIGLVGFIFFSSIYMNLDLGLAPYDATPKLISDHLPKVPFTLVRMCWDFAVIGVGILFGGLPPIGTIVLALTLGPMVSFVGKRMKKA